MARPTRDIRRSAFNIAELNSGDWVILGSSILLFIALIPNWWVSGMSENSAWRSEIYMIVMLLLILATIALLVYPLLQSEASMPGLPFASPPVFILIGFVIFLFSLYELGRFTGVGQPGVSPGFGIYLAMISSVLYLVGALIKWGSRERRNRA